MVELITVAEAGQACEPPTLQMISKDGTVHLVQAHLSADPSGLRFLLVLAKAAQPR
ncbi:MAG: hypothetical protein H7Y33_20225 [Cytophagales bacterium]|nr:hypothetical protein [Rhizobacter sp.]